MARAPLTSTLAESTGTTSASLEAALRPPPEEAPDVLDPILPPEGIIATSLSAAAKAVAQDRAGRVDIGGVHGGASAALIAAIARQSRESTLLAVTPDGDAARRLADEVGFFLGKKETEEDDLESSDVLLLQGSEASPYADVNPDRRAALSRMATLFHLATLPFKVLVVPASALVRKLVPRKVVAHHAVKIVAEEELDRDETVRKLSEGGYVRVPVVEDPGSFAVRGALLDVWPPGRDAPVRVELYGELVVSIKAFDPFEQRTKKKDGVEETLGSVWLPPAREAILSEKHVAASRNVLEAMTDAIDMPTGKARALAEDVATGRAFFGADGFLPSYYGALEPLGAYLPRGTTVIVTEPGEVVAAVKDELTRAESDEREKGRAPHFERSAFYLEEAELQADLGTRRVTVLHGTPVHGAPDGTLDDLAVARPPAPGEEILQLAARDHSSLSRAVKAARTSRGKTATLAPLAKRIRDWHDHGLRVFITARAETQAERLTTLLRHQKIDCKARLGAFDPAWLAPAHDLHDAHDSRDGTADAAARIVVGPLSRGAVLPADGLVLVTEEEVFGTRAHRRRESKGTPKARAFLEDLRSLSVGDYVVHSEHGIGKYLGLVHRTVGGLTVDLLTVEYAGGDKLYLPVYRLNQIQKYSGGENANPKTDKLGGTSFQKTKAKVRGAVRQMADELLRLYAERQAEVGIALPPADDEYRAFEATFPFDETPDQAKAIDDVNRDLEAPRPMDRLVCGDVGFGKTEVAIRAAFRVAAAGRQVALLCPTTVLAQQHLRTFEARLQGTAMILRGMSRFQTAKEHTETLRMTKEGKCDIVVGTHRLLSKDIHFKDLGLLIVDEEQRFGVTHKERIKQMRKNVDVLTLTATPIPRTLQMAVSGLRDLSLITTAPVDRRAIRTIVTRMDDQVIKDAVTREMARGGQVFYVYNRVEALYEKAQKLAQLVPEARIAVGHGQMGGPVRRAASGKASAKGAAGESLANDKAERTSPLEEVMLDFVEGRYDVLCATAIVESGLDISRANTIIIDRADLFGLAQLYQLRGRVGRSKERAYCYLVVPPFDVMTDEARARIEALERHTELGSGFQIASLDLELRGAGDLLGGEQSGNVASVGFDLFVQMLEEAVHELRGEPVVHELDPDLSLDVTALVPEDYVTDVGVRLSLYKRLASAIDEGHVAEIAEEMEERFGPPPEDARRFVQAMRLKTELRRLRALGIEASSRSVTLHLKDDTPLDPKKILDLVRSARSPYKLTPDMRLLRRFPEGTMTNGLANAETVLAELAGCLR